MKRSLTASLAGLFVCAFAVSAYAGYRDTQQEDEVLVNHTTNTAWGSMGAARNSADSNQYIGVDNWWVKGASSFEGRVYIRDASGAYAGCWTEDPNMITVIRSAPSDGKLTVQWNASTGECTYVQVFNVSYNAPKPR
jgi:hypothetical protein